MLRRQENSAAIVSFSKHFSGNVSPHVNFNPSQMDEPLLLSFLETTVSTSLFSFRTSTGIYVAQGSGVVTFVSQPSGLEAMLVSMQEDTYLSLGKKRVDILGLQNITAKSSISAKLATVSVPQRLTFHSNNW